MLHHGAVISLFVLIWFKPAVSWIQATLSCGESTSGNSNNMPLDITFTAGPDPITFSTCNSDDTRDPYLYYGGNACNPGSSNPSGCTACANNHPIWTKTFPSGQRVMQFYWNGGSGQSYYQIDMICPTNDPTTFPTVTPTNNPTSTPTAPGQTKKPSVSPTDNPTNIPTQTTNDPTTHPSETPTKMPSVTPTTDPTNKPSDNPTQSPTDYAFCTNNNDNINAGFITLNNKWSNVICEFCVCRDHTISNLICDTIDFNNLKSYDSYLIDTFMQKCQLDQECSFKQVGLKRPSEDITTCNCDLFQCNPQGNNANTFLFGVLVVLEAIIVMFSL